MKPTISSLPFALVASLALTACGGAPSEAEIKATIEKQIAAERQAIQKMAGTQGTAMVNSLVPEIKSIKKIGCKDDGEKAYLCDVEMEVSQAGSTGKGVGPMRFVKGSDGWLLQK